VALGTVRVEKPSKYLMTFEDVTLKCLPYLSPWCHLRGECVNARPGPPVLFLAGRMC